MYTYEINFKNGKQLVGSKVIIEENSVSLVDYMRKITKYCNNEIKSVIEKRFFRGEIKEKILFENK